MLHRMEPRSGLRRSDLQHAAHLICTTCYRLRSVDTDDCTRPSDHCECWRGAKETSSESALSCTICATCALEIVPGHSRWATFHCARCMPYVRGINDTVGYLLIPIGRHSIVNQVNPFSPASSLTAEQMTAWLDQLQAMSRSTEKLFEHRDTTVRDRVEMFQFGDLEVVDFDRYLAQCTRHRIDGRDGMAQLGMRLVEELVDQLGSVRTVEQPHGGVSE